MTMHKSLHPRDDTDKIYESRKGGGGGGGGGGGLTNIEDSVDASKTTSKGGENDLLQRLETAKTT